MEDTTLTGLRHRVVDEFRHRFNRDPTVLVAAPGRVNLIGEHIDYNDGFVLPLALQRYVLIAADPREQAEGDRSIRLHSLQLPATQQINLDEQRTPGREDWVRYVEGVIAGFQRIGHSVEPFDAVVGSTVPVGGGLSSSAALEVATATLLEQLGGTVMEQTDKALLCQRAEHEYAGVPCGIMDQFSSVFGRENELMLIDCQSQTVQMVPFQTDDISILVTNSLVKHELSGGEYAIRRQQCDDALSKLRQTSWRSVTLDLIEETKDQLSDQQCDRAYHVVTEIERTRLAVIACQQQNWSRLGQLMYESHESLRDQFAVSCHELDRLVDIAKEIGSAGGVLGSRMTGGGFGGCTVSLVANDRLEPVIDQISRRYHSETGITPECFSTHPGQGAHVIERPQTGSTQTSSAQSTSPQASLSQNDSRQGTSSQSGPPAQANNALG